MTRHSRDNPRCSKAAMQEVFSEVAVARFLALLKESLDHAENRLLAAVAAGDADSFFRSHVFDVLLEMQSERLSMQLAFCTALGGSFSAFLDGEPAWDLAHATTQAAADYAELPSVRESQVHFASHLQQLTLRLHALRFGTASGPNETALPLGPGDIVMAFVLALSSLSIPIHEDLKRFLVDQLVRHLRTSAAGIYEDATKALENPDITLAQSKLFGDHVSEISTLAAAKSVAQNPMATVIARSSDRIGTASAPRRAMPAALATERKAEPPSTTSKTSTVPGKQRQTPTMAQRRRGNARMRAPLFEPLQSLSRPGMRRHVGSAMALALMAALLVFGYSLQRRPGAHPQPEKTALPAFSSNAMPSPSPAQQPVETLAPLDTAKNPAPAPSVGVTPSPAPSTLPTPLPTAPVAQRASPALPPKRSPAPAQQPAPEELHGAALRKVRVKNYAWRRNPVDHSVQLRIEIFNGSAAGVRNIRLGCFSYADDLTRLESFRVRLTQPIAPGASAIFQNVKLGSLHKKTVRLRCAVDELETYTVSASR